MSSPKRRAHDGDVLIPALGGGSLVTHNEASFF